MTQKEGIAEALKKLGVEFEETENRISFMTKLWVVDHFFDAKGKLTGLAQGNLAAVSKLKLHG